ncbi:AAA family ATPase [Oceanobacillus rekensis]|uniref:AAA family ATPase n=1 Tax=Oceanobacillus rekensis TaxID=937927 RepID=UPI000B42DD05|nr:P-loop NTPase [Oceanobacillus rekensis]
MTETQDIKRIVVCSAVGGVGRTTITVNLAALLAKENITVSVIDADLQFGDIALAFDLQPSLTIKDAAERNDKENIYFYMMDHASSVKVLPAPDRPEFAELISPDFLSAIIDRLEDNTEIMLVETQAGLTDMNIQLMEQADLILVVSTPAMAALKNSKLMIETLDLLGIKDKAHLVINRFTTQTVIRPKNIPELTNMEQIIFLPLVDKQMEQSLDIGIPFVTSHPKASFTKELEKAIGDLLHLKENKKIKSKSKLGFLHHIRLKGTEQGG